MTSSTTQVDGAGQALPQPYILLDQGDVCHRYLRRRLELPLEAGLCTNAPRYLVIDAMDPKAPWRQALLCEEHAAELRAKRPDWVEWISSL